MCPTGPTLQITRRDCRPRWTISPLPLNADGRLPRSHGARRYGDYPCRSDGRSDLRSPSAASRDFTGPHRDPRTGRPSLPLRYTMRAPGPLPIARLVWTTHGRLRWRRGRARFRRGASVPSKYVRELLSPLTKARGVSATCPQPQRARQSSIARSSSWPTCGALSRSAAGRCGARGPGGTVRSSLARSASSVSL
jgi:hypothetical protein